MSKKIEKLIASALNNSSANEAAQALKVAATNMQIEGINPAEYLRHKDDFTEGNFKEKLNNALDEVNYWRNAFNTKQNNSKELKEAKQVAVRWHREAQEALESASHYQKSYVNAESKRQTLKVWVRRLVIGMILCSAGSAIATGGYVGSNYQNDVKSLSMQDTELKKENKLMHSQIALLNKDAKENSQLKLQNQKISDEIKTLNSKSLSLSENKNNQSQGSAICFIKGKIFNPKNSKRQKLKFIYKNGEVISVVDGNYEGIDDEVNLDTFLNNINTYYPGKANCVKGATD